MYPIGQKSNDDVERVTQDADGWTALHVMAHNGHPEGVRFLLSANADVNARDGR
jgi:ankyrin repeat protein